MPRQPEVVKHCTEQPESAQNEVTANFWPSFETRPYEKAVKIGPSCVVKWEKRNSHRASRRF
jgi:hypothetical protein